MAIDIKAFSKRFEEIYTDLYNNGNPSNYHQAVNSFDDFAVSHKDFVSGFCKYINDFISSDREAAAFMYTLSEFVAE